MHWAHKMVYLQNKTSHPSVVLSSMKYFRFTSESAFFLLCPFIFNIIKGMIKFDFFPLRLLRPWLAKLSHRHSFKHSRHSYNAACISESFRHQSQSPDTNLIDDELAIIGYSERHYTELIRVRTCWFRIISAAIAQL